MAGFSVDLDELRHAASRLHSLHTELVTTADSASKVAPPQVGHVELASALAVFRDDSQHATSCLLEDTEATADRLSLNAERYRHAQEGVENAFGGGQAG